MTDDAVKVERSGPVTTVLLHRPARRNAVDSPTAPPPTVTRRWA